MTDINLCPDVWKLYDLWTALLERKRPKATASEIGKAKRAYIEHRKTCKKCTPWRENNVSVIENVLQ